MTDVDTSSAAHALWEELVAIDGVAGVRAGKLLARKRPQLIPIWDSVVQHTLRPAESQYWISLRECLREDDFQIVKTLEDEVRPQWLSRAVSDLRVLDVAAWMTCSRGEAVKRVRGKLGFVPDERLCADGEANPHQ